MTKATVACLVLGFVSLIVTPTSHVIEPYILSYVGGGLIGFGLTNFLMS